MPHVICEGPTTELKGTDLFEIAFVWELTKETTVLPLGCLQGGEGPTTELKETDPAGSVKKK